MEREKTKPQKFTHKVAFLVWYSVTVHTYHPIMYTWWGVHADSWVGFVLFGYKLFHPQPGSAWVDGKLAELAEQDGGTL